MMRVERTDAVAAGRARLAAFKALKSGGPSSAVSPERRLGLLSQNHIGVCNQRERSLTTALGNVSEGNLNLQSLEHVPRGPSNCTEIELSASDDDLNFASSRNSARSNNSYVAALCERDSPFQPDSDDAVSIPLGQGPFQEKETHIHVEQRNTDLKDFTSGLGGEQEQIRTVEKEKSIIFPIDESSLVRSAMLEHDSAELDRLKKLTIVQAVELAEIKSERDKLVQQVEDQKVALNLASHKKGSFQQWMKRADVASATARAKVALSQEQLVSETNGLDHSCDQEYRCEQEPRRLEISDGRQCSDEISSASPCRRDLTGAECSTSNHTEVIQKLQLSMDKLLLEVDAQSIEIERLFSENVNLKTKLTMREVGESYEKDPESNRAGYACDGQVSENPRGLVERLTAQLDHEIMEKRKMREEFEVVLGTLRAQILLVKRAGELALTGKDPFQTAGFFEFFGSRSLGET